MPNTATADAPRFQEIVDFIRTTFGEPEAFIPLHEPRFLAKDEEYVVDCVRSTFVSSVGKYVDLFEEKMADWVGSRYAVATVNGTTALQVALRLAGVRPADLVITQPFTFVATANAIRYNGADPVFVDIDAETLGLCPLALERFLKEEVKQNADGEAIHIDSGRRIMACVPMHTYGFAAHIERIVALCSAAGIPVVEDAAESLGSYVGQRHTGTFGRLGTFSFNGNKTITCGGGGIIVTDDEQLAQRAKYLTTTAKKPHRWEYFHDTIGYNYRLPNLNAALACAQMEHLRDFLARKEQLAQAYAAFFHQKADLEFRLAPQGTQANYWLNVLLLRDRTHRDAFLAYTNDRGVMTRPAWELMYRLPMYADCPREECPTAEALAERLVNLPSSVILKD